jgi:hypothetical protein
LRYLDGSYNPLFNNCNHFTHAFLEERANLDVAKAQKEADALSSENIEEEKSQEEVRRNVEQIKKTWTSRIKAIRR